MKNKLAWTALIFSFSAVAAVVGVPIYVEHEHSQALKRQAEWEASTAEERRTPPAFGCAGDHYRVMDYSGPFPTSIPVWTDKGVMECDGDNYSVNGNIVSSDQARNFAMQVLREHQEERETTPPTPSTGPVVDPAAIVQTICESVPTEKPETPELAELAAFCESSQ